MIGWYDGADFQQESWRCCSHHPIVIAKIVAIAAAAVIVAAAIAAGRTGFGRAKGGGSRGGPCGDVFELTSGVSGEMADKNAAWIF